MFIIQLTNSQKIQLFSNFFQQNPNGPNRESRKRNARGTSGRPLPAFILGVRFLIQGHYTLPTKFNFKKLLFNSSELKFNSSKITFNSIGATFDSIGAVPHSTSGHHSSSKPERVKEKPLFSILTLTVASLRTSGTMSNPML